MFPLQNYQKCHDTGTRKFINKNHIKSMVRTNLSMGNTKEKASDAKM